MSLLNSMQIKQASIEWTTLRKRMFGDEDVLMCPTFDILSVGSVWNVDPGWLQRANQPKHARLLQALQTVGWTEENPAILGMAANGFVTLLDGNHRIVMLLVHRLIGAIPLIPAKIHFFDVGDPINPLAPDRKWDGKNLGFICYPRGTCGKCVPCRRTIGPIRALLDELRVP